MDYRKAANLYQQSNLSTIPTVEYVLLLLKETVKNINMYENALAIVNPGEEPNYYLSIAQQLLFELLATTDRETEEGERLYTFYAYLNQCLVEVRLSNDSTALVAVVEHLQRLIDSWEESKRRTRIRTYTSPWI